MPFVSINAAMPISEAKMDVIQKEIGRIIALIPGKTIDNCMTQIVGDANMFMSGGPKKAVYCEVRVYGPAPKESKDNVVAALDELFQTELGCEKMYVNFVESTEWGNGGSDAKK